MKLLFAFILVAAVFPHSVRAQSQHVTTLSWMSGCWLSAQGSGEVEENWTRPKGGTMIGISRTVRGERTTGFEYVRIHSGAERLIYTASPSGQAEADFGATLVSDTMLRVEKPDHDFPQKIEYESFSPQSMIARVFGNADDNEPAFVLNFARVACE